MPWPPGPLRQGRARIDLAAYGATLFSAARAPAPRPVAITTSTLELLTILSGRS